MKPGSRVLYVDGDDAGSEPGRRLEQRGFEVREPDDPAAALESLGWADCVVAEYDLPDGDGIELLRRVRERAPDLPFVLYTGAGSETVASEAIGAGVTDYLPKERGARVLADRLERATGSAREEAARSPTGAELVEQLALPVYATDADGVVTVFNDRAAEVTGYDPDAIVGSRASELLSADELDRAETIVRDLTAAGGGETTTYNLAVQTADGGVLEVENHVSLLTRGDDLLGTAGVLVRTDGRPEGRLRRLHDATRELMAEADPERVAERTTAVARDVVDISDAAVYFADGDELELVAATEVHHEADGDPPAAVETAYRTGEPRIEVPEDPGEGTGGGGAYLPLGDHGALAVAAPGTSVLTAAEVQLATILAANAEAALDRVASEAALRQERDDLEALFENIPDPAIETSMQDGEPIVERVNPAFEEVFGYGGEELRGESVDDYIVPDGYETEATSYNDRVEGGEGFHGEVRRRTADGLRDFILHVVAHDIGATETRGYAIYTDITEQKQRQRELERQNRRIEALHDVTKRMKSAADREAIYDIVIDAAEEILEFDLSLIDEVEDDVLISKAISSGVDLEDYYEETPLDREDNLGAETARTGETFVVDDLRGSRYAPANFEYRSALSVPLGDRGIFQAVAREEAAFSTDDRQLAELLAEHAVAAINRQERERELEERAEELARQNERLDRFASVVSHDLRNPISVARGRLELARSSGDEKHYEAVERAHERMDELVNDLLTLARQGELKSNPMPVDLRNAADQAWRTVETGDLELVAEEAPTVRADPERLRQLLENLFTNTVEHGGGATTVTVGAVEGVEGFYVADDGAGIPEGEREEIFESGRSGTEEGTGLGLAIVDTIADAHGWEVAVTESESGGARFEFTGTGDDTDW